MADCVYRPNGNKQPYTISNFIIAYHKKGKDMPKDSCSADILFTQKHQPALDPYNTNTNSMPALYTSPKLPVNFNPLLP